MVVDVLLAIFLCNICELFLYYFKNWLLYISSKFYVIFLFNIFESVQHTTLTGKGFCRTETKKRPVRLHPHPSLVISRISPPKVRLENPFRIVRQFEGSNKFTFLGSVVFRPIPRI